MAQRRFGPIRAAGVGIEEQEGEKQIERAALGLAGYAAILEKGKVGELIEAYDKTEFARKCGGIIDDSLAPDAAQDYFSLAAGAGGLLLVRVTDGNEQPASITLYQRNAALLTPMGTVAADNGGRWGGKEALFASDLDAIGGLTETTLQVGAADVAAFTTDQYKGGYIELNAVANTRYKIIGNTSGGLFTVEADQTMLTDHGGGGDLRYYLVLENDAKAISVQVGDGEDSPTTEFSLSVFVDGDFVKKYGNLSTDPNNARYWVDIINNDDGNNEIFVTDLVTGSHTAATRPANHYGLIDTVTATVLTAVIHDFTVNAPVSGGNPTFALGTTADRQVPQTITITMTAATTGTAVSSVFGDLGIVTLGTLFDPPNAAGGADANKYVPPFTVTAGATPLVATDTLVINYKPFKADALIGGLLWGDKVNFKSETFRIADNDHSTITILSGDLTTNSSPTDEFMVSAPQEMAGGVDGNADIVDASYEQQAWDVDSSPFNDVEGKNLGLIKFGTPGVTSTVVQKAGIAYAYAKNHQYRVEIPANIVTESSARDYMNDTIGRSDYSVYSFPSYGDVAHPTVAFAREGRTKQVSLTGMIHGREARIAADFDGYHKAEAGIDATLPRLLKLPTGNKKLNEELLNPAGIGVIKKVRGNFVVWGDRTAHLDSSWRFKHHREQMSYYEHVLQENFDFIIFAINDPISDALALATLQTFFIPEFTKRAIRGKTFADAAKIKVDSEINTDATRAAGDKYAEVSLLLADTTERFIIKIGKQGIFESVA